MSARLPNYIRALVVAGAPASVIAFSVVAMFEGERTTPYLDIVGKPTKCFGDTSDVDMTRVYSHEECVAALDVNVKAQLGWVYRQLGWVPNPPTAAALVSFTYNVGRTNAASSTPFRRMRARDVPGGCEALLLWDKVTVNGRKVRSQGVYNRRVQERELCLMGVQ